MTFKNFLAALSLASLSIAPSVLADVRKESPRMEAILGGQAVDPNKLPMAIVAGDKSYCSGLLVGEKTILTAAHCIDSTPLVNYRVVIGGAIRYAAATAVHPSYNAASSDRVEQAKHDVAYITLTHPVSSITPVPILLDRPLKINEKITIHAFGSSEKPDSAFEYLYQTAKKATLVIEDAFEGLLLSTFTGSSAAMCSGDSGGGAVFNLYGKDVAVGVVSIGTSILNADGSCSENKEAEFTAYVDLQSPFVKDFIGSAPGILRAKSNLLMFSKRAGDLVPDIKKALKAKTVKAVNQKLARVKSGLKGLNKLGDAKRLSKVRTALRIVQGLAKAKSLKRAVSELKKLNALFIGFGRLTLE